MHAIKSLNHVLPFHRTFDTTAPGVLGNVAGATATKLRHNPNRRVLMVRKPCATHAVRDSARVIQGHHCEMKMVDMYVEIATEFSPRLVLSAVTSDSVTLAIGTVHGVGARTRNALVRGLALTGQRRCVHPVAVGGVMDTLGRCS